MSNLELHFKATIEEFIDAITDVFPNEKKLKQFKAAYYLVPDIKIIVNELYKYVKPYDKQIREHDDAFFLGFDVATLGIEDDIVPGFSISSELDYIKALYPKMDEDNKRVCWEYITLLYQLSQKIVEK